MISTPIARAEPMDRGTFDQPIRAFEHHKPFRPFKVAMENGDRLEVDRPDALAFHDGCPSLWGTRGIQSFFDHEGVNRIVGTLAGMPMGEAKHKFDRRYPSTRGATKYRN